MKHMLTAPYRPELKNIINIQRRLWKSSNASRGSTTTPNSQALRFKVPQMNNLPTGNSTSKESLQKLSIDPFEVCVDDSDSEIYLLFVAPLARITEIDFEKYRSSAYRMVKATLEKPTEDSNIYRRFPKF